MGVSAGHDRDYSLRLAERAFELIRAHGSPASPRAYAVWYSYVAGQHPALSQTIKSLTAENGTLADTDIEQLHETYLDDKRLVGDAQRTSASLLHEVDDLTDTMDLALGSTSRYGESLEALSRSLTGPMVNRERVREVVGALAATTREVAATNRTLEARMRESRAEMEHLREALQAVETDMLTDALTGVSNRKHFDDVIVRSVEDAAGSHVPLSLVILDIDGFRRFNDEHGHLIGDAVLRLVATAMRERVTAAATLARLGGEEFAIVLPGTEGVEARTVAERVRTCVMSRGIVRRSTGETLGKATISLGIATLRSGDSAVTLLERADQCLQEAKRTGRNRSVEDADLLADALEPA